MKTKEVKPTAKQRAAFKAYTEKPRPYSEAMRIAGYSERTIEQPQNLTESDGWKQLVAQYLPDELLASVHRDGLEATKDGEPDHNTRHKFLTTAYHIKGRGESKAITVNIATIIAERREGRDNTPQDE